METKYLVEFIEGEVFATAGRDRRCYQEIAVRLKRYDKLKENIEKLCQRLSNGVDKEG